MPNGLTELFYGFAHERQRTNETQIVNGLSKGCHLHNKYYITNSSRCVMIDNAISSTKIEKKKTSKKTTKTTSFVYFLLLLDFWFDFKGDQHFIFLF